MPLPTTERVEQLLGGVDADLLHDTWATVMRLGDQVPTHFYSTLFLLDPTIGAMFPPSMARQRDAVMTAIGAAVASVGDPGSFPQLPQILVRLGMDHRKYGVEAAHYPTVGSALLSTLRFHLGAAFNDEVRSTWTDAYTLIAEFMAGAAADAEASGLPAWWDSVIDRITITESVVRLHLKTATPYDLGFASHLTLCHLAHPGNWRGAAATQEDHGHLTAIVAIDEDDPATMELAHSSTEGNYVRLGPPLELAQPVEENQ